jgi:hypothetical protein
MATLHVKHKAPAGMALRVAHIIAIHGSALTNITTT